MSSGYSQLYRTLLFAVLSMLLLVQPRQARAADFTAGISNTNGAVAIWFQSNVSSTMAIASYRINGGAQQNVNMTAKGGGRFELPINATAGDSVSLKFTYNLANGTESFVDFQPYTVPDGSGSPGKVATPVFNPPAGSYSGTQQVTVSSATAGATVYCSINGAAATACAAPLTVSATTTIVASASKDGMTNSDGASATYTIAPNNGGGGGSTHGVLDNGSTLTLWMTPGEASTQSIAHYVLNGAGQENVFMTMNNGRYERTINVTAGVNVTLTYSFDYMTSTGQKAMPGAAWSRESPGTVTAPAISPNGGTVSTSQAVTLSAPAGTIYYTTDGADPATSGTAYSGPFTLSASAVVKAVARANGAASPVTSATFTVNAVVAAPVISPNGGAISSSQQVTLSAPAGTIYYTTNGADPATSGMPYSGPLTLAASATVKAIARVNSANSSVTSASFTVGTAAYEHGILENAGTARAWIKLPQSTALGEAHIRIAGSANYDDRMTWNAAWQRWEGRTFNVAPNTRIGYFFVYNISGAGGNTQTENYYYDTCGAASTAPGCPGAVLKPLFSLAGGTYSSAQTLTLALAGGAPAGTQLRYTTDGSDATPSSPLYSGPLAIASTMRVSAIAVQPDGLAASMAQSYVIEAPCAQQAGGCAVGAPELSHASGSYSTEVRLSMKAPAIGATVHYTLDGSEPGATSPQYRSSFSLLDLRDQGKGNTYTVKAVAVKDGVVSAVTERVYTILSNARSPWSGITAFRLENQTGLPDSEVYWFMIGKHWDTKQFVRVMPNGTLQELSMADNNTTYTDPLGGTLPYADISMKLSDVREIPVPPIESARIYMSVKKPVLINVHYNPVENKIAYAGPNLQNFTDPNIDTRFEFAEFNINRPTQPGNPGIYVNTSRVDLFSFPVQLHVTGEDGFDATVGESMAISANELFARYTTETPEQFHKLYQVVEGKPNVKRIMAPAHGNFNSRETDTQGNVQREAGENEHYLDDYITSVWNKYRSEPLVINLEGRPSPLVGRVGDNDWMTFTDDQGSYYIKGKPRTDQVLLGAGLLDDASGTVLYTEPYHKQLQLQAQMCAALNRHVAELPFSQWWNHAAFYPAGQPANWFAQFWHRYSINGLAYGFAYDDVGSQSPSIYTPSPKKVTYTIGNVNWQP